MGLFDSFWAKVECPYRDHEEEMEFQTKAFEDRVLRHVKAGDSTKGWEIGDGFDVHGDFRAGEHRVLILDGLGECDRCRDMNMVVGMGRRDSESPPMMPVQADIVIVDDVFVGVAHVRADEDYFKQAFLKGGSIRLPRRPEYPYGRKVGERRRKAMEEEESKYYTEVSSIERRLMLRDNFLLRLRWER